MRKFSVFAVICTVILVMASLSLSLSAADTSAADTSAEDGVMTITSFDNDTAGWQRGDNVSEVLCTTFAPENDPYEPSRNCLAVTSYDLAVNLIRSAKTELTKPLNLTEYRTFSYEIFALPYTADPYAVYFTRLIMHTASGETIESLETLEAGVWTRIDVDIGSYAGREAITSIEIGLLVSTTVDGYNKTNFYIDTLSARNMVDRELTDRFLFDLYTISGGRADMSADKTQLKLSVNGDIMLLDAMVILPELDRDVNRLRIKLANHTNIDTMTLYYSTSDTPLLSEYKSVTIKLEKQSDSQYYYADVGDASMLRSIRMQFGDGTGTIEIDSICVISAYEPDEFETCGLITACLLSDDQRSVSFVGEVSRDEALNNRSGQIAVYALEPDEAVDIEQLAASEPLVTAPMTTKFELLLKNFSRETLYKKFVALSLDENGSAKLIAAPFYLNNPERAAQVSVEAAIGAKGLVSSDMSVVGQAAAEVTVLNFDILAAFTAKSEGERYSCFGQGYYLSTAYLESVDRQITVMKNAGVPVILRLYAEERAFPDTLDALYRDDSYVDYSNFSSEPDGSSYLTAISSYIAGRWMIDGSVVGVIFGEAANILEEGETLGDAIRRTAVDLRTIYQCITAVNSEAKVYLSVTDIYSVELATKTEEIGLEQYVTALAEEIGSGGQFEWNLCIENLYRISESDDPCVTAGNCSLLTNLLWQLGLSENKLIFCDNTLTFPKLRLSDAIAAFVYGYYGAYFNSRVDAYIPVINSGSTASNIAECVRMIDTEDGQVIATVALTTLKAEKWVDLVEGYDAKRLPKKQIREVEASLEEPSGIKGAYDYYTFDAFTGSGELQPGYHCTSLTVENGVLLAKLNSSTSGNASCMGIAHRFEYSENLTLTPVLAITLTVDDVVPSSLTEVPVTLVLTAENERFEATAAVAVGLKTTIYVDIGEFESAKNTEGLQLLVGDSLRSATLSVERIEGLSKDYNDESLESVIADERARRRSPQASQEYGAYIWVGGAIIVAVATILTVVLLSRKKKK
ncbi:MAG: hypothetical protein IJ493_10925 [Clostridia bacterium]|nr:hypothetical protein [Clostridia bacterium]